MITQDEYLSTIQQIQHLLTAGEATRAYNLSKNLLEKDPENPAVQFSCSGSFIDCGNELRDLKLIELGIDLIEKLKESDDCPVGVNYGMLLYNLSNGYGEIAALKQSTGEHQAMLEAFQKQKQSLQSVLLERKSIPEELIPNILTNYANLLDHLGRTVEAVDHYYDCLELAPEHAVAMGNCGEAIQRLFNISPLHNEKLLYESWQLLKAANERESSISQVSGKRARIRCRDRLNNIETYIESQISGGCEAFKTHITGFVEVHKSRPSELAQRFKQDRLLLTVSPYLSNCTLEHKDDVFFGDIVVPLQEPQQRFNDMAHALNHIKEDFATARYLYYQSQSQVPELVEASAMTSYADTLDYAVFGLRSGFLKSSLRLATDMFDKCAGFLNLYLELGHPEDKVIFSNVWYNKRQYKKGLHENIETLLKANHFLAALYDINKDLYSGTYPAPFRSIRNDATHKRLVLSWYGSLDETGSTIHDLSDFQEHVRILLRMAKAAVIYLVAVVDVEEKRRKAERVTRGKNSGVIPSLSSRLGRGLSDQESQEQQTYKKDTDPDSCL